LVGAQHRAEFFRHGYRDVEVMGWQHLGPAGFEPVLGLVRVALRATPILAGMIREYLGAALFAAPEVSAQDLGAAGLDVGDGAPM